MHARKYIKVLIDIRYAPRKYYDACYEPTLLKFATQMCKLQTDMI